MKPPIVLLAAFIATAVICKFTTGNWQLTTSGNTAMCLMLCFTALGHFMFTKGMTLMIPGFIPFKKELVYFTGVAEIVMGLALLFPPLRQSFGIILIFFLVLMLPANINAALKHINYETATTDGKRINYLWFRIPLQAFFIVWDIYFSVIS